MMNRFLLIIVALLVTFPSISWAACPETATSCVVVGSSYTADTACYVDVKDCTDQIDTDSAYGATLNIPACATDACGTWDTPITITKNMRIVGLGVIGVNDTHLVINNANGAFLIDPDATAIANTDQLSDTGIFEVTNIHFYHASPRVSASATYGLKADNRTTPVSPGLAVKRLRIHHNKFSNLYSAMHVNGYIHGLFDNNTMIETNTPKNESSGVATEIWTNDPRHVGTSEAFYSEDNTYYFSTDHGTVGIGSQIGIMNDNNHGQSAVARYNTVVSDGPPGNHAWITPWEVHSPNSQFAEIYGNKITTVNSGLANNTQLRSGTILDFFNQEIDLNLRAEYGYALTVSEYSGEPDITVCAYATAYQPYAGTSPQICNDSIDPGDDCACHKLHHTYIFGSRLANGNLVVPEEMEDSWNTDGVGVGFTNGDHAAVAGETVHGGTSAATLVVNLIAISGGSWGGTAAGVLYARSSATKVGTWELGENVLDSANNVIGVVSDIAVTQPDNTGLGTVTKPELVSNREYFFYTGTFTGEASVDAAIATSNGIGCGSAVERDAITPSLANVAWWVPVTPSDCSSVAGYVGDSTQRTAGTATYIQGTLYRWNGSAWVSWYTPYTYPHPLRGDGGSGHSFSGGATHSFTGGSTITWQ